MCLSEGVFMVYRIKITRLAIYKGLSITSSIDNGCVTQGTARARPAPSACVLLLQEIVLQLLIGNDYANSSIPKTYFLILFRSLSHPCTADKAYFNLTLRLDNITGNESRPMGWLIYHHQNSRKRPENPLPVPGFRYMGTSEVSISLPPSRFPGVGKLTETGWGFAARFPKPLPYL